MKWKKAETEEREDCRIIRYRADEMPEALIESRRHNVPHANGYGGLWQYTDYVLIVNGVEERYCALAKAKEAAEKRRKKMERGESNDKVQG